MKHRSYLKRNNCAISSPRLPPKLIVPLTSFFSVLVLRPVHSVHSVSSHRRASFSSSRGTRPGSSRLSRESRPSTRVTRIRWLAGSNEQRESKVEPPTDSARGSRPPLLFPNVSLSASEIMPLHDIITSEASAVGSECRFTPESP